MSVHVRIASLLFVTSVAVIARAADTPAQDRASERTFAEMLSTTRWITVDEGFVLLLRTDEQVEKVEKRRAAYAKRRTEYLAKFKPLKEKCDTIKADLPANEMGMAESLFGRYDQNKDGEIDKDEQRSIRGGSFGLNQDGKVSPSEFAKSMLRRRAPNLPENWEALVEEWATVYAQQAKLKGEYSDGASLRVFPTYYSVEEVGKDFIRIRSDNHERWIPLHSVIEVRTTLTD